MSSTSFSIAAPVGFGSPEDCSWLLDSAFSSPCAIRQLPPLIAQQVRPKVLQGRLGDASFKTTLDTYGHLFEGLDEAAADARNEAIGRWAAGFS